MSRFTAKIINAGRVTIPEEIRIARSLQEGDLIELDIVSIVKPPLGVA